MNTPKKPKRHKVNARSGDGVDGVGIYALDNVEVAAAFGEFVAAFEHLEGFLTYPLAILLGGHDTTTAGYVLRAIRNPKAKRDLMRDLLEKAPINKDLPEIFDFILQEYEELSKLRNNHVHGKWFTQHPSQEVFVSPTDDHGLEILAAKKVEAAFFKDLTRRASNLSMLIILELQDTLENRRKPLEDRAESNDASS